jgi:hypothetical protein
MPAPRINVAKACLLIALEEQASSQHQRQLYHVREGLKLATDVVFR